MNNLYSLLLYNLYAPSWSARKLDKFATSKVKNIYGVKDSVNAGNFNKMILPDCKELQDCANHIASVRNEFYLRTAPWGDMRGLRVGKAEYHMELMQWFGDKQSELKPLLNAFEYIYPNKITEVLTYSNLFNLTDYPDWDIVKQKFNLHLTVQPLPNTNDIRILKEIPIHVREQIEKDLTTEFRQVENMSIENSLSPLVSKLNHMAEVLTKFDTGTTKQLRKSLLENVHEMAEVAKRLNISRNHEIDELANKAMDLAWIPIEDLKQSDGERKARAKQAEDLVEKMKNLFG